MPNQGIKIDISAQIVGYLASLKKLKLMAANIDLGSSLGKSVSAAIKSAEKELTVLQKNPIQTAKSLGQIEGILNKANRVGQAIQNIGAMMQGVTSKDLNLAVLGELFTKLGDKINLLEGKKKGFVDLGIQDAIKNSALLKAALDALGVSTDKMTLKKGGDILALGLKRAQALALQAITTVNNLQEKLNEKRASSAEKVMNNPFSGGKFDTSAFTNSLKNIINPGQIVDNNKILELKQRIVDALNNMNLSSDQINQGKSIMDSWIKLNMNPELARAATANFLKAITEGLNISQELAKANFFGGQTPKQTALSLIGIDNNALLAAKLELRAKVKEIRGGLDPTKDVAPLLAKIDASQTVKDILQAKADINAAMHKGNELTKSQLKEDLAEIQRLTNQLAEAIMKRDQLVAKAQTIEKGKNTYDNTTTQLRQLKADLENLIKSLRLQIVQLTAPKVEDIRKGAGDATLSAASLNQGAEAAARYSAELANVQAKLQLVGKIQGVVQRWFSVYAAVRMVSNAIRSVISTIQLLDKTITEIAIVTDMDQNDLWGQMDKYTDMANKYAASISGVYKVSQLYYQQGLQTNDVMALTEQTLKMARISGLDYLAATNYMTNAVRSFKMLMTDAQQVVDTYSAVAASSATSVSELATAMSKTASSAQAVGSSFQNTTAMMAVMIEATRESAENIGSAMKSIISRYGEMTSDPSKMTDSEGLEMSLNRVDKALKTVGITLQTAEGQFRDFDDVIMELASKWNTLDTNTQRYIATIMAGNRLNLLAVTWTAFIIILIKQRELRGLPLSFLNQTYIVI